MKNFESIKKLVGLGIVLGALGSTAQASAAGELIVNEYNAVSVDKMLDDCQDDPQRGDQFFHCEEGNGDDWIEFVVTEDGLNIQGWTVYWENADTGSHANNGHFTFSNDAIWDGLYAGTIITVYFDDPATTESSPHLHPTWVNYNDPCSDENWQIAVSVLDTDYIDEAPIFNNLSYLGEGLKVDNDDWAVMIHDASSNTVQGWVGENETLWAGAGVSGEETGKLEANPVGGTSDVNYVDGDSSTFAAPNFWTGTGAPQSLDTLCNTACGTTCCSGGGYGCYVRNYTYYY